MELTINKRKLLWVLSDVIDLVGVTDLFHGKRVAYIADRIRGELKDFVWSQDDVIISSLLHDCGVSSTDIHEHLVLEMEWSKAHDHCERGKRLLQTQKNLSHLAGVIEKHHSRWSQIPHDAEGMLANLIFLADRIDILAATSGEDILVARSRISQKIASLKGTLFCRELVDIFLKLAEKEVFWLKWGESYSEHIMGHWINQGEPEKIEFSQLKDLFTLFGLCVDGKSPYTYNHSIGVAALAKKIAQLSRIEQLQIQKIELAGLMHDLGKLRVPDNILEKPARLDDNETQTMRHHSYDTFSILSRITGLEEIAQWTAQHHEKLNGRGYPEGIGESGLALEARILTVADIFQALAQDRPYRKGLSLEEITSNLDRMVESKEIDGYVVNLVKQNGPVCFEAALTLPPDR